MIGLVDYSGDIHDKDSRKSDNLISYGSYDEQKAILDGISGFSIFDADRVESLELRCKGMIEKGAKGKYRARTIDISRRRMKYFFGYGYEYGHGKGNEKVFDPGDISPIPDWITDHIIKPMERANIVQKDWIDSVVVNDYEPGGFIVQHNDPIHLFERPIYILTLFSDAALSFGCNIRFNRSVTPVEVTTSDPILRLPMHRGIISRFHGHSMDDVKHCIRPIDTPKRRVAIILRKTCDNAPVMKPTTNGESLRKFDPKLHKKIKKRCEKMIETLIEPYERSFTFVDIKKEKPESTGGKPKQKVKEPWKLTKPKKEIKSEKLSKNAQKLKKKGIGTFHLDKPVEKTDADREWNFGESPTRKQKDDWSSDEERLKKKRVGKTNDMADLIYDFHNQGADEKDVEIKSIERVVHMKKSRKQRGREFRDKINSKFGFRENVIDSDSDSDASVSSTEVVPKKSRPNKFTF